MTFDPSTDQAPTVDPRHVLEFDMARSNDEAPTSTAKPKADDWPDNPAPTFCPGDPA